MVSSSHVVSATPSSSCSSSAPVWGPSHRVTGAASKPAPAWAPLHRATGADRSLLQHGLSMGSQLPSGTSTCSNVGSAMGCRWVSAPPWTSMDCRGTTCLTMVFTTGCRGISALVPGAPPPPSSLTLVSAGLFHTHIFSVIASAQHFLALLKYVITEVLPALLMGSALTSSRSVLKLAGTGCAQHGGNSWCLLTEATPAAPASTPS